MTPRLSPAILAFSLSLLVGPLLLEAQTISFEVVAEFAYPGAHSTNAYGIDGGGDVVGSMHLDGVDFANGFIRSANGSFSLPIIFPGNGVRDTIATAINDNGTIAGWYADSAGVTHGFFFAGGVYTSYDHPNALFGTRINGINDFGDFVGTYSHKAGVFRGFANVGGKLRDITIPGVALAEPFDIDDRGDIAGTADEAGFRRERRRGRVRYPLQRESGIATSLFGANQRRETVGQESGASGLYFDGRSTYLVYNFPGLINNALTGINTLGLICGYGFDSADLKLHSYLVRRVISPGAE